MGTALSIIYVKVYIQKKKYQSMCKESHCIRLNARSGRATVRYGPDGDALRHNKGDGVISSNFWEYEFDYA